MALDPLDALLERSAPAARAADPADVQAMIAGAAQEARPPRSQRRIGIFAGVLSLVLVGGSGVAVASSPWLWGAGMHSNRAYEYTSPTWGTCELRLGNFVAANPLRQLELDHVIDEWFATADVAAQVQPLVGGYLEVIEELRANEPELITDPRLPDLNYREAIDQALGDALQEELSARMFVNGMLARISFARRCENAHQA